MTAAVRVPEVSWGTLPEQVASLDRRVDPIRELRDLSGRACKGGDVAGCALLGLAEIQASEGGKDAFVRLERACDAGYARACRWLGRSSYDEHGANNARAFGYYDKACTLGDVDGCVSAAGARMSIDPPEEKMPASDREAIRRCGMRMAHELCEAGHAPACMGIGFMHLEGTLAPDPEVGLQYLERSCSAGQKPACQAIADLYGSRAEWQKSRSPGPCPAEPRLAPLTVMPDRVPRLATAEPNLVDAVREIEKSMSKVLEDQRKLAMDTARGNSNGDAQCRGSDTCSCIGPASKCAPQGCEVTRNDGVRLFIECSTEDYYASRYFRRNWGLRYQRVGNRFVRLERLRDLLPGATPMAQNRLVETGQVGGRFAWLKSAAEQDTVGQVLLMPKHLYARTDQDPDASWCKARYGDLAPFVGCGPLASLAGKAALDDKPLGYTSAPLAWTRVSSGWENERGGGGDDADFAAFSSHLPSQQKVVASLNAWVRKHRDCRVHLSTAELVSASCGDWYDQSKSDLAIETEPIDKTRLVRLRDGTDIGLGQILTQPRQQLALLASRCFGVWGQTKGYESCRLDPKCLSWRHDPVDAVATLTEGSIRGFTLDGTGVEFRVQAAVKDRGHATVVHTKCRLSYAELKLSLDALGR